MREILMGRIGTLTEPGVFRVLVDRLWPRGVSKLGAPWDYWEKDLAPSTALRQWYAHKEVRYEEFRQRYAQELEQQRDGRAVTELRQRLTRQPVILLTASRVIETSQVPILRAFLVSLPDPSWNETSERFT
jgi:uncharacterized protein YeaO (DUF488 family)